MVRRFFICAGLMVVVAAIADGQMVASSAIGNDAGKEALCATRARVQPVPFMIDQGYVNSMRVAHPETTFIAEDGIVPLLLACRVNERTGVFEWDALSYVEDVYWHLVRPEPFAPSVDEAWQMKADDACFKAARGKVSGGKFDHSFGYTTDVNVMTLNVSPWYRPGVRVAGMAAERWDISVVGKLFYRSTGADLKIYRAVCLLSPGLDVKSVEAREESAERELRMETKFNKPFKK